MIRHQVYFDTLGSMQEDSASWRAVFAGLSVLRLVDAYTDTGSSVDPANWAQLHSVRAAIEVVSEGDAVRGVLTNVLDEVTKRGTIDETVCRALLAYGRVLDYAATWGLAVDVFSTVVKMARPEKNAKLAVEAHVAVGGSARRNGDWDTSARAYSQAAYIADTLGDQQGVLTVQVGIANTYLAKGNLQLAQTILDDVLVQAREKELPEVQSIALHSRAALAANKGNYAEGLKLAHDAFELTTNPTSRDAVLDDIAGMFSMLGLRESARDSHVILAATTQSAMVRAQATINLMELAGQDGNIEVFDTYAREMAQARLSPWHRAHYLLMLGEGMNTLGRSDAAVEALTEAVSFAESNQIHQVAFKAQAALVAIRSIPPTSKPFVASPTWVPEEVNTVVRAMSELRKTAVAVT
jgi:tetratricopeptide (TPR) repeat protein